MLRIPRPMRPGRRQSFILLRLRSKEKFKEEQVQKAPFCFEQGPFTVESLAITNLLIFRTVPEISGLSSAARAVYNAIIFFVDFFSMHPSMQSQETTAQKEARHEGRVKKGIATCKKLTHVQRSKGAKNAM